MLINKETLAHIVYMNNTCLTLTRLCICVLYPENGIIKSDRVYEVMLATDRAHYSKCNPYMDSPQSIGT